MIHAYPTGLTSNTKCIILQQNIIMFIVVAFVLSTEFKENCNDGGKTNGYIYATKILVHSQTGCDALLVLLVSCRILVSKNYVV